MEKVSVAIYCNLMPCSVMQLILSFNYEAHIARAYEFNNFVISVDHSTSAHQILMYSGNPHLSCNDLTIENLGFVCHLGFLQ